MLWKGRRESGNVIDRRKFGTGTLGGGGLVIGAVIYYLMGGNPLDFVAQNIENVNSAPVVESPKDEERKKFVSVVLADTEDVWNSLFQKSGKAYREPALVLFRGSVSSACGRASSAMGPFYCPGDQRVYLDMSFFDDLSQSLGARGEFAAAYVIAHEVGHHVQTLLGLEEQARQQQTLSHANKNQISVKVELQADCLAGVWAKQTQVSKDVIEEGDINQALGAASAVGDDRLQKRSQGYVVPDSFTHGSSSQRVEAFRTGFDTGQLQACLN